MNIMLMGCSWGVPNYNKLKGDPPETHTDFLLQDLGHTVYNCSQNGLGNLSSCDRAERLINYIAISKATLVLDEWISLPQDQQIDLVIWFHTDPGRDINIISTANKSVNTQLEELTCIIYERYALLFEQMKCKVAIIGACADVHPTIKNYIKYDYLLPSWQKELLGVGTNFFRIESGLRVPSNEDITLIENANQVLRAMEKNSTLFPDGGHPGKIAHKALVDTLRAANLGI